MREYYRYRKTVSTGLRKFPPDFSRAGRFVVGRLAFGKQPPFFSLFFDDFEHGSNVVTFAAANLDRAEQSENRRPKLRVVGRQPHVAADACRQSRRASWFRPPLLEIHVPLSIPLSASHASQNDPVDPCSCHLRYWQITCSRRPTSSSDCPPTYDRSKSPCNASCTSSSAKLRITSPSIQPTV